MQIKAVHQYLVTEADKKSDFGQVIHAICCGIKLVEEKGLRSIAAAEMAHLVPR